MRTKLCGAQHHRREGSMPLPGLRRGGFRFGPDILVSQQKVAVNPQYEELQLTLTCEDDDVTGANESSDEGTAEIYGRVEHRNGDGGVDSLSTLEVECP